MQKIILYTIGGVTILENTDSRENDEYYNLFSVEKEYYKRETPTNNTRVKVWGKGIFPYTENITHYIT